MIVWVDEAGFYLLPGLVRTWAPVGQTPIVRWRMTNDHLAAISGITAEGKLYMMVQDRPFKSPDVVRFLKHLLRHIPGKVLVIWDNAPIHRSQPIKDFLSAGAAARLHLERLPAYAPDFQPDEGIWKHLKYVELRNLSCDSLATLKPQLRRAKERLRHKVSVIQGCVRQPGYQL